jgi:hypothetical protein
LRVVVVVVADDDVVVGVVLAAAAVLSATVAAAVLVVAARVLFMLCLCLLWPLLVCALMRRFVSDDVYVPRAAPTRRLALARPHQNHHLPQS